MTLSDRNSFFKAGIFFCAVIILLIVTASFWTVPIYPRIEENSSRPDGFFRIITGWILGGNFYAVHTELSLAAVFSFVVMIIILFHFERTPAPEILYIAIFTISLSFEAFKLFLPLYLVFNFPSFYLRITARVLLFARFFGIFSLFTAGLCAAGLNIQKYRNAIFIMIIAVLAITLGIPIDVHTWDTSFNFINGYTVTFRMVEILVFITTVASFLIAAKARDSKEYVYVAVGAIFALSGRSILLGTDNWIGVSFGITLLIIGIWLLCTKVHKIHLWL